MQRHRGTAAGCVDADADALTCLRANVACDSGEEAYAYRCKSAGKTADVEEKPKCPHGLVRPCGHFGGGVAVRKEKGTRGENVLRYHVYKEKVKQRTLTQGKRRSLYQNN